MYLLDANAFMEASRLYYAFDIAPGFWAWLETAITTGDLASVTAVKDEITAGKDPLVHWAGRLPKDVWLGDDQHSLAEMTQIVTWGDWRRPCVHAGSDRRVPRVRRPTPRRPGCGPRCDRRHTRTPRTSIQEARQDPRRVRRPRGCLDRPIHHLPATRTQARVLGSRKRALSGGARKQDEPCRREDHLQSRSRIGLR